jgi:hypothetical protein
MGSGYRSATERLAARLAARLTLSQPPPMPATTTESFAIMRKPCHDSGRTARWG